MGQRGASPAVNMDFSSTQRLGVIVLLLQLSNVRIEGLIHNLNCDNDYLSTINCTLNSNLSSAFSTMWLKLIESYGEEFLCHLSQVDEHFFCSVQIESGFVDTDVYNISLCHEQNETESCERLDNGYKPVETIKPKPPCCLTLNQNSSQLHFSWKSTYETTTDYTDLMNYLTYQLQFYKRGHQYNGTSHNVNVDKTTFTLKDYKFIPDSEYAAKVRSSPNKAFYKGQWSDWSTEVHWRTDPAVDENNALVFNLENVLIPVCVLMPVILILCFVPIKKWKQSVFIPTPEPYFQTLYSDCQGDFKSWVIMKEKIIDVPKTEKTLPIDKLSKCKDICEAEPGVTERSGYINMSEPECTMVELGFPYAVSTSGLGSATASYMSTYLSPQSGSPAEGDSGCWLSSDQSLEKGPPWYCNDYCTLSTFQQSALGTSYHGSESLKHSARMIIGHDEIEETQSICL